MPKSKVETLRLKLSKVDDKIKEFLEQHNYCHNSIPYGTEPVQYGTCCVLTLEFFYTQYSNSTFDESGKSSMAVDDALEKKH